MRSTAGALLQYTDIYFNPTGAPEDNFLFRLGCAYKSIFLSALSDFEHCILSSGCACISLLFSTCEMHWIAARSIVPVQLQAVRIACHVK